MPSDYDRFVNGPSTSEDPQWRRAYDNAFDAAYNAAWDASGGDPQYRSRNGSQAQ